MTSKNRRRVALAASVLAALGLSQAEALTIVLNDVSSTPMDADQLAAFQEAANSWENTFDDPITVNIDVAFNNLANNILGSTQTARTSSSYSNVRSAMASDAAFGAESLAMSNLPSSDVDVQDTNGTRSATTVTLSTANAKALGLGTGLDSTYTNPPVGVDAVITFNTDFETDFDYDPTDGVSAGKTDFVSVAKHEIGHALGFFSVTDVQDFNPSFTLQPNTLDLWRYEETGAAHPIGTGTRLITAGAAEYYDTVMNNVSFSHGSAVVDTVCNTFSGQCQASHWSDDLGNLMDPTIATDIQISIDFDDEHALDYAGYDQHPWICIWCWEPPILVLRWWWEIDPPWWEGYPIPKWEYQPPEWANLAFTAAMDFEQLGSRGIVGYARFDEGGDLDPRVIKPLKDIPGEMNLYPEAEPARFKAPALYEMTFDSDEEAGVPFHFESTCGTNGCEFDPSLGEYGGYRVPGFIDALGDQPDDEKQFDVDGRYTMILLADEKQIPDARGMNVFKTDPGNTDNALNIHDHKAFGLEPPKDSDEDGVPDEVDNCLRAGNPDQRDTDADGIGNACDADIAQPNDCNVNFSDLGTLKAAMFSAPGKENWNPDADLDGDGNVNFLDLGIVKEQFFATPGPSGVPNDCD